MPSKTPRLTAVMLVTTLLVAWPSAAAFAAEDEEAPLCTAATLEAIDALSGLKYVNPGFGSASFCFFEASPDQQGPHSVYVETREWPSGVTLDDFKEAQPDITEVMVADRPGYISDTSENTSVTVDLGDRFLLVSVALQGSAEAEGIDAVEYALDVAEIVVSGLDAGSVATGPSQAQSPIPLPSVVGIDWTRVSEWDGEQIQSRSGEIELELWKQLLNASGASFDQAQRLEATVANAEEGRIGNYSVFRIAGADSTQLKPVVIDWLREATGADDFTVVERTVGGKDVTAISFAGAPAGYLYLSGDSIHFVTFAEELAAAVLEALS